MKLNVQQRLAQLRRLAVGHFVPTTAVLAKPARNKAKALFRSKAPARLRSSGDDSKAAHLRQPLLWRRRLDLRKKEKSFPTTRVDVPRERLASRRCLRGVARGAEQRRGC
jgi:hypothetical protein